MIKWSLPVQKMGDISKRIELIPYTSIFFKTSLRDEFNGTKHYGILSENLANSVVSNEHKLGYKSDHSLVLLKIDVTQHTRGPGYFK